MESRRTDRVGRRLDTMRRDHFQPFDAEADEASDVTHEFWGTTRGWTPRTTQPTESVEADDNEWRDAPTSQLRAIRANLSVGRPRSAPAQRGRATGSIDRTRSHGIVRPQSDPSPGAGVSKHREATLGELASGLTSTHKAIDADWDPFFDDDIDWSQATQRWTRVTPATTGQSRQTRPPREANPSRPIRPTAPVLDDHDHEIPLSPVTQLGQRLGLGAVDPLLVRLGAIVLVGVMLVPFARALRPDDATALAVNSASAAMTIEAPAGTIAPGAPVVIDATPVVSGTAAAAAAPTPADTTAAAPSAQLATEFVTDADVDDDTATEVDDSGVSELAAVPQDEPAVESADAATVSIPAERVEPDCSLSYEAGSGDSWYRIADAAGVTPQALLDQNLATVDTTIFPGDQICLPAGATVPSQPTTTTSAPSTTEAPSTTKAPTTTAAPATTPAPKPASTSEVQAMIREIWPDELEEKALNIAWRESNFKATAYNGTCCWGVFQIHWTSHKSWLDDHGIYSTNDLLDARKNITAAYALYQRAGGWGPWGG
jgi:hypothetical protein